MGEEKNKFYDFIFKGKWKKIPNNKTIQDINSDYQTWSYIWAGNYDGDMFNNSPHGTGVINMIILDSKSNSSVYNRTAFSKKYTGGVFSMDGTILTKAKYTGEFKNGKYHGIGVLEIEGKDYSDQFLLHNTGPNHPLIFEGKSSKLAKYSGEFKNGKFHKGCYENFLNATKYTGEFKKSINTIQYLFYHNFFDEKDIIWYESVFGSDVDFDGKCIIEYENGDKYTGYISRGCISGKGLYSMKKNNHKISGNFREATNSINKFKFPQLSKLQNLSGVGRITYPSGNIFKGVFSYACPYKGKLINKDGSFYIGTFYQDDSLEAKYKTGKKTLKNGEQLILYNGSELRFDKSKTIEEFEESIKPLPHNLAKEVVDSINTEDWPGELNISDLPEDEQSKYLKKNNNVSELDFESSIYKDEPPFPSDDFFKLDDN